MKPKSFTVRELLNIARIDQCDDDKRPWNFTSNCHDCGGTGAFLYWLEKHPYHEDEHEVEIKIVTKSNTPILDSVTNKLALFFTNKEIEYIKNHCGDDFTLFDACKEAFSIKEKVYQNNLNEE